MNQCQPIGNVCFVTKMLLSFCKIRRDESQLENMTEGQTLCIVMTVVKAFGTLEETVAQLGNGCTG